ncbi:hypothetical protein BHE74_00013183 [Ensete ventricosum]|nr:hypothetical protein GW17_00015977 [Ensete ventricosum]RWW78587.1 hypothetical protein BHE74_00013183 [Ensete ventricosum]
MDFVSRHAASASANHHHPPPVEAAPAPVPAGPAVPEEPEYLARYMAIKHSWRGRYKRIFCISSSGIVTLDPSTLVVTNSYDIAADFEGAAPVLGRGDDVGSQEFTVSVRTDGKGKFKAIKFSSRFRASILTALHRLRWGKDMDSPAIILLADNYGNRSVDTGGFVLCPMYGRKSKAFTAAAGASNSAIVSYLKKREKKNLESGLVLRPCDPLPVGEESPVRSVWGEGTRRSKEAVGANETPYGGWSVTRLRSAAKGTANVDTLSLGIGPKGGLGEQGDSVSRQLILTKIAIVERRPDNYEVLWMLFCTNSDLMFWRHCII